MNAWDGGALDEHSAADWHYEFDEATNMGCVYDALGSVLEAGDRYIGFGEACHVLAACEVVARLKRSWDQRADGAQAIAKCVETDWQQHRDALVSTALRAIDRVRTPPSEVLELWSPEEEASWQRAVDNLRARVAN